MKKKDFITQYIISRASMHDVTGAEMLERWYETEDTRLDPNIKNYQHNIEIEISNAEIIAEALEDRNYFD